MLRFKNMVTGEIVAEFKDWEEIKAKGGLSALLPKEEYKDIWLEELAIQENIKNKKGIEFDFVIRGEEQDRLNYIQRIEDGIKYYRKCPHLRIHESEIILELEYWLSLFRNKEDWHILTKYFVSRTKYWIV